MKLIDKSNIENLQKAFEENKIALIDNKNYNSFEDYYNSQKVNGSVEEHIGIKITRALEKLYTDKNITQKIHIK